MARILTAGAELGDQRADKFYTWVGSLANRITGTVPSSPQGNRSNYAFYTTQNTGSEYDFEPDYPAGLNEVYIRMHQYIGGRSDGTWELFRLTTADGSVLLRHAIIDGGSGATNGGLFYNAFYDSAGSQFVNSSGYNYRNSEWHLFELHIKFGGSGARLELKMDGTKSIDWTGSLTGPSAESAFTKLRLYSFQISGGAAATRYYDNIAINDTTGTINNSWIGEGYIMPFYPEGNGSTTQLVNSENTSVDNFSFINQRRAYNVMSFVAPTAPNDKDTYVLSGPAPEWNGVNAIAVTANAVRYGNAITQARLLIQPLAQLEVQGPAQPIVMGEDDYIRSEFGINPNTSLPWTVAELKAMEAGIQFLA